ncbi:MAG TPA: signal peptidase II [Firmicutes bacterium]|nr:signal peptidase II [Bacillota bacterium]
MYILLAFVLIAVDQLTKYWVQQNIPLWESIPIIKNVFHLTHVHNPGAAFSILAHQKWFFVLTAVIAIVAVWLLRKAITQQGRLFKWGLAMALAGAIGNLIDRLRLDVVVDFFDFQIWPVFNVADICIVLGVCILIGTILRQDVIGKRS